ncbi:MAG: alanine--tRNA ligase [Pseudomonadota bacterium]|nr:alanine--tRNA ligase [Pseudomonadota bacterium]
MKSADIREAFLSFFEGKGHARVESGSLIPNNDPTLLFTAAGMVPFKNVFNGLEKRPYTTATTAQRCLRAGGKHNDLENVGYTARHHTFFEMLGNFSFGDYFKRDAIKYAWEFVTEVLKLPKEKLWVTVHITDQEAEDIWVNEIGFDKSRMSRLDEDNFWQAGDTGPCGPSSEIFYDHGEDVAGGPPGSPDEDGDRYIEIWNLVFMQFDRQADGEFKPLPKPSIDTGMGLERIAAVMQHVHSNYEIDVFATMIKEIAEIVKFDAKALEDAGIKDADKSLRVIADHIRAIAFLMIEGVRPSNEGRGYVLRRIMRRALRHGYKVGSKEVFLSKCIGPLIAQMGDVAPELEQQRKVLEQVIDHEENQFRQTLDQGMKILSEDMAEIKAAKGNEVSGKTLFVLYDTYGFPVDLTADIARENDLNVDMPGFEALMEEQRARSRANSNFEQAAAAIADLEGNTHFTGYEQNQDTANVYKLVADGQNVEQLQEGQQGILVSQQSPFYGESGGQVGDTGVISSDKGEFKVTNTTKQGSHHLHHGVVTRGTVSVGDRSVFAIDAQRRASIKRNHSATHLLDAALRKLLGEHVNQKGSLVEENRLRFDFSHQQALTQDEIAAIENLVNEHVLHNEPVVTEVMSMDDAKAKGAIALFGEKYDDTVRVLSMGALEQESHFSIELCGGTHVAATGDIGLFKITSESGVAAGVRRIEAVTGQAALKFVADLQAAQRQVAQTLKTDPSRLQERSVQVMAELKEKDSTIAAANQKLALFRASELVEESETIGGVKVVAQFVEGISSANLKPLVEQVKEKLGQGIVLLVIADGEKVQLGAGVTSDFTSKVKAGDLVKTAAVAVGGKGGGRPDFAMAGGTDKSRVHEAVSVAKDWLNEKLA